MKTYTTLPNLPKSFRLLKIAIDLDTHVSEESILGHSIKQGMRKGRIKEVIKMISDQAKDNLECIQNLVGHKTLTAIWEYEKMEN